ncbi:MAG: hypothetical protein VW803_06345 [Aquiluna sp.]
MLLEVLLVLLLIGAVAATMLSFFIGRKNSAEQATPETSETDNPQINI